MQIIKILNVVYIFILLSALAFGLFLNNSLSSVKETKDLTQTEKDALAASALDANNQQHIDMEWGKLYREYINNNKVSQKTAYNNVVMIRQMLNGSITCK